MVFVNPWDEYVFIWWPLACEFHVVLRAAEEVVLDVDTNFYREACAYGCVCTVSAAVFEETITSRLLAPPLLDVSPAISEAVDRVSEREEKPGGAKVKESDIQGAFNAAFESLAVTRGESVLKFVDTHKTKYLGSRYMPDLSFMMYGGRPMTAGVHTLGELCPELDDSHWGKTMRYLSLSLDAQPDRAGIAAFVSTQKATGVLLARREAGGRTTYVQATGTWNEMKDIIKRILNVSVDPVVVQDPGDGHNIPLGPIVGSGATSSAYFAEDGNVYKVFRSTAAAIRADQEIRVLSDIRDISGVPALLAERTLYTTGRLPVIMMKFHGYPLSLRDVTPNRLMQLARVLSRVHGKNWVHRDIRLPNVVLDTTSDDLTLIDWGFAQRAGDSAARIGSFVTAPVKLISLLDGSGSEYACSWKDDIESLCRLAWYCACQPLRVKLHSAEERWRGGSVNDACAQWRDAWADPFLDGLRGCLDALGDRFCEEETFIRTKFEPLVTKLGLCFTVS